MLVGSPAYFAWHGLPLYPCDLLLHQCLQHKFPLSGKLEVWPRRVNLPELAPLLPESMVANNIETLTFVALQDMGIVFVPTFTVQRQLHNGQLQRVFENYPDQPDTFSMLRPASRHTSPTLRVLIDYLSEQMFPSA